MKARIALESIVDADKPLAPPVEFEPSRPGQSVMATRLDDIIRLASQARGTPSMPPLEARILRDREVVRLISMAWENMLRLVDRIDKLS